jgi:hypothetical protein
MTRIDAHAHIVSTSPAFAAAMADLKMVVVNIAITSGADGKHEYPADRYRRLADSQPDLYRWCTTINSPDGTRDYADREIEALDRDLACGAVACKIWKHIGMGHKNDAGHFIKLDVPDLGPIFSHLERAGMPLVLHVGDPPAAWQALSDCSVHSAYYREKPQWHMYRQPGAPSLTELLAARDRVLQRYLAKALDRFPNLAIDSSGCEKDLMPQERSRVRGFFQKYEGRILFGSDIVWQDDAVESAEHTDDMWKIVKRYRTKIEYSESDGPVSYRGISSQGLGLRGDCRQALFSDAAKHWLGLKQENGAKSGPLGQPGYQGM